jgi:hypothetical protein
MIVESPTYLHVEAEPFENLHLASRYRVFPLLYQLLNFHH